jgi:hypothetical protein
MCSAAPSIGKARRFNVRYQGIAGMDGPVAGRHRVAIDPGCVKTHLGI